MATIVKLRNSDKHAILVGVGYGMYQSARPNAFFGDLLPNEQSGSSQMAAVSTATGEILWCKSEDLKIVSVDGQKPSQLLQTYFSTPQS
jgi:hypothetical protein